MKKNILAFGILAFTLFSCGNESGGNKNIIPADNSAETATAEHSETAAPAELKKELQWTAFKTPEKVGVNGTFKNISLTDTKEGKTIQESIEGAKFSCEGTTVTTGDTSRDGTLNNFFFKKLSSPEITGSFGKFKNNKVPVTITLNGKTTTKEFSYAEQNNELSIRGSIDMIKDFSADTAFNSLHEACAGLHMGKTWTDVDIAVKISK